jgi:hypothetical protein
LNIGDMLNDDHAFSPLDPGKTDFGFTSSVYWLGALPSLVLRAGRFTARSKGKEISGAMPHEALEAIKAAGL